MPPRRKAAGAAAKKGKKDVKKEEEEVEQSAETLPVKVEESETAQAEGEQQQEASTSTSTKSDVKPSTTTTATAQATKPAARSSGRSTRRGKKAATTDDTEDNANVELEPDIKSGVKDKIQVKEEKSTSSAAATTATSGAAVDASQQLLEPAASADDELPSGATTPASQKDDAPTPDIIGVIENREDEDIVMDDAEPAPMDAEEVRRLQERPSQAVDTSSQPAPLHANSGKLAAKQLSEGLVARQAISGEASTSRNGSAAPSDESGNTPLTREERMAKMNALRKRMNESATANRKDVVTAQNDHRKALAESKRLERKRKQAEAMGEKLEAMETGEDLERKRNWEYSLADNEAWSKKQARKERRMDTGFSTFDESARRKYRRDIDTFKPDLKSYQAQKAAALGLTPEEAAQISFHGAEGSSELIPHASTSTGTQLVPGSDQLYRDANSFVYADHKPSDDAIDRVVGKLNLDLDKRAKRSRARVEDEGDITYINDRNKVFNKKLERYFNKVRSGHLHFSFRRSAANDVRMVSSTVHGGDQVKLRERYCFVKMVSESISVCNILFSVSCARCCIGKIIPGLHRCFASKDTIAT